MAEDDKPMSGNLFTSMSWLKLSDALLMSRRTTADVFFLSIAVRIRSEVEISEVSVE